MAFKLAQFGSDSSNVKSILGGVNYYRYYNKDNNTLTGPGYFPSDLGLEVGDRIHVVPATKTDPDEIYVVNTIVNGVITVKQIDTDGAVDSVNGKTGNVVLGANDVLPTQTDNSGKFLTTNGTDASWASVDALPSQIGNSGKFLTTDGTDASWATISALQNTATGATGLIIGGNAISNDYNSVVIGYNAGNNKTGGENVLLGANAKVNPNASSDIKNGVVIGSGAQINGDTSIALGNLAIAGNAFDRGAIAIGYSSNSTFRASIAIGKQARTGARYAIQLNASDTEKVNSDTNTFKVANENGNYEMMSADGTIPAARHASLPVADGTYVLKLTISGGVPTLSWVAE